MLPPLVSVVLPVHNGDRYLKKAVESILKQTLEDFELLALDDGSSDSSLSVLNEYSARDARMQVLARQNRGITAALNELISVARGKYLARMDADDISLPARFAKQVEFLETHPQHVVVGGQVEWMNEAGQLIGVVRSPASHELIDQTHLRGHTSVCHPTAMMRRDAVVAVGGYRDEFAWAEDLDLWLRLGEIGSLANLGDVVLRYRLHERSISARRQAVQLARKRRACEEAWGRRGIVGTYEADSAWRAGKDAVSQHKYALRYGWMAWQHGHRGTCRTYAWRALRLDPLALRSWQLVYGAVLKASPRRD